MNESLNFNERLINIIFAQFNRIFRHLVLKRVIIQIPGLFNVTL